MPVEIFWLSFHVFVCACPTVISSIFGKSFHFPFVYFVLFVLQYFPFHVVYNLILDTYDYILTTDSILSGGGISGQ